MYIRRLLRVWRQRLRSLLRQEALDSELDRELAFHLDQLTRENLASGLSLEEARQAALRAFGNPAVVAERSRDQRRVTWLRDLHQDALYGVRMFRRSPGFTAMAVASLALGIGANTAVLSALHAALVRTLPFTHADRLVIMRTFPLDNPQQVRGASILDYLAWKDRARTLDAIGASLSGPRQFGAEPDGTPAESIPGQAFTPGLFPMLGIQPAHGRLFDDAPDAFSAPAPVVVISHRLWQQRYSGASDIIGRNVTVDGAPRRIVAVMPRDFRFQGDNVDCWLPLLFGPNAARRPGPGRPFAVTGRLKPGVTLAQAQADFDAIAAELARDSPQHHEGWGIRVQPLRDAMYGWTKPPLFTLQGAVAMVLLIAWTNVAGLLLARGTVRQREIALRVALGASRGRIVRQLLAEGVLLSAAGALLGLIVAWAGLAALTTALGPPPAAPRLGEIGLDVRVLAVTVLLSMLSALAFGLAPAFAGAKLDLTSALYASAPAIGVHPGQHRRRSLLVAAQIALALVLLIGAGLLSKSFIRLTGREINIDPKGLLTFEYYSSLPSEYAKQRGSVDGPPQFEINPKPSRTLERVYDRLRLLPEIQSVAGISYPPVNSLVLPTAVVTASGPRLGLAQTVACFLVTPNFFATMRTPLVQGREFDAGDTAGAPWVAVVNEAMARRFWPAENAVGKHVTIDGPDERPREVVGVVRNIPTRFNQIEAEPIIYTSYLQGPSHYAGRWVGMFGQMTFALRHAGDPAAALSAARQAVAEVDPNRSIVNVGTVERHLFARLRESRNYVVALAVFALTATLLSAIGIYGVTAHAVSQRTREIGIRRALGAGTREIITLVARRVLAVIAAGLVSGVSAALALTRLIESQLWGVTATDPATYVGVCLLLAAVALLACLVPTRRAITVDPTAVLRCE